MTTEVQLQLQLDGNGRTTWIRDAQTNEGEVSVTNESTIEGNRKLGDESGARDIHYETKTVLTSLVSPSVNEEDEEWRSWMDNLLFDCEVCSCAL